MQNVFLIGRDPGKPCAIRRELRSNFIGIAKEDIARNQRRKICPSLRCLSQTKNEIEPGGQTVKDEPKRIYHHGTLSIKALQTRGLDFVLRLLSIEVIYRAEPQLGEKCRQS